ncbi:MAG: DoxX family protein [Candidatus Liptonbacteria bacterium RIFCSPLOWO2_01_FULL_52_25]|uniref:DoxX family protein n=1 Tax=Candidatus Liptonbacteria bacterium RIFCSPLOWO2_01_FULL_52_25 TaxID=1798650 RepID=A0A1G2CEM9_9BACT|nr:MAG: DoxX family protein [Candidatus Liptonbacteria bacterium RIFCSPLOWO2_01_FULL_52_25]
MSNVQIPEPKLSQFLFSDSRVSWLWLAVRVYVGYDWLMAGWGKFVNPAWVGSDAGTSIAKFFQGAVEKTAGAHPAVSAWYGWFLTHVAIPNATFFSYLITFGEIAVGVGLILGAFTGLAAFFGAFMNFNFLFAGTISLNPVLLFIQLFLILAWRNAGWWGLDRFLLPRLGVPWQPGTAFKKKN